MVLRVLLYELVSGTSPFRTAEARKLYEGGGSRRQSSDAGDECGVPFLLFGRPEGLLAKLLEKDPEQRLVTNVALQRSSSLDW